jgi:lysophospholipase L1-like esterase
MKTILCYGDSITWGRNAVDGTRFPFEQRWPGILQAGLGNDYRIVEEGLGGRTVATESWAMPHRDGRAMLAPILESHAPLDWVIIMLGTNDCADISSQRGRHCVRRHDDALEHREVGRWTTGRSTSDAPGVTAALRQAVVVHGAFLPRR